MTRHDIRHHNLTLLIQEFGTATALAEATEASEKYISQIISKTPLPSGNPRQVGNNLARRLEQAASKPEGWMDQDHSQLPAAGNGELSQIEAELLRHFRQASSAKRRAIMAVARLQTKA